MRIVITEVLTKKAPPEDAAKEESLTSSSSSNNKSRVGTLFLVTCTGGTVGREGNHDVLIQDIGCSKFHAKIEFK